MSSVRFTVPKHRLAQLLRTPGGLPVEEALQGAEANLKELQGPCLTELQGLLAEAETAFAGLGAEPDDAGLAGLYAIAVRGVGLGEVSGAGGVDVALTSLCDLVDHLRTNGRYDRAAVGVHVRAWRLLLGGDLPQEACQAVLAGLTQVSARYDAPKPA